MQPSAALERKDTQELETLIAKLKTEGASDLLIEHLQTACAYLQGAMPEECTHNLEMAREAAGALVSKPLEREILRTIDDILQELHPPVHAHWRHQASPDGHTPRPTANGLEEFFHGTDFSLGMFYPKKHVVGVFSSYQGAQFAHYRLWAAGFREWEAMAVPGYAVAEFLSRIRGQQSWWSLLATHLSRILDTEVGLTDRYLYWARRGDAFLIAYSPTQEQAEGIQNLVKPLRPVDLHWFMPSSIRDLR